jgi:hypothetical protein
MYEEEGEVRVKTGSEPDVAVIPHSEDQLGRLRGMKRGHTW